MITLSSKPSIASRGRTIWAVTFIFMQEKGWNVIQENAESLPFSDNFFDIVVCCNLLQLVLSFNKAIQELRRVLKNDGLLLISIPWEQKPPSPVMNSKDIYLPQLRIFNNDNFDDRFLSQGLPLLSKQYIKEKKAPLSKSAKYIATMNLIFKIADV